MRFGAATQPAEAPKRYDDVGPRVKHDGLDMGLVTAKSRPGSVIAGARVLTVA